MSCGLDYGETVATLLVDGLTALGFHLVARHAEDFVGWTVHLSEPPFDFFLTGNGRDGSVVGRAFGNDGDLDDGGLLICQSKRPGEDLEESTIAIEGSSFFGFVETWYEEEERAARFFVEGGQRAFLVSLPGGDREWVAGREAEQVFELPHLDDVSFLADRVFVFHCGCDREKITQHLVARYGETPEALFGSERHVEVHCPRCGVKYSVTPEDYERWRGPGASPR
jgi:molecular chaperone Hsp33